ncbi:MAG: hypothetical protein GX101_01810 [Firmicutes bacterium]|jgi:hypothetical protein|nr:ATP synthase subunit I [Bacillota bacterium]NLO65408.1 hypothetical protein [Bacillota bacterium]
MFNENHVLRTTIQLTLISGAVFLVFQSRIAFGLMLGGFMASLAFRLMIIDATKLLDFAVGAPLSRKQVKRYNRRAYLKRYLLYTAALAAAISSPYLSFFAALVGLLMPKIAIVYLMFRRRMLNDGT